MTEEVASAALKYLFDQAFMSPKEAQVNVTLFGGEPLIRPDMCDYIIREGIRLGKEYKIKFSAGIITNGTIMSDEIELMLYRWKSQIPFSIQISIDGDKEAQDLYRVRKDGSSSFADVEKNVPIFRRIDPKLCLHGCINKDTMPLLYNSYRYFVDKWDHRGSIWFMPVHTVEWDENDVKIYDEQLSMILAHETSRFNSVSVYTPLDRLLPCGGNYRHPQKTCGAGVSYLSICGNGDVYPCHNFYFSADRRGEYLIAGNVLKNPVITNPEIFKPFEVVDQVALGCDKCECTACYRCYADNWTYNGDIAKQVGKDSIRCELSHVERKYQLAAVKWADTYFSKQRQGGSCQTCAPKIQDPTLDKIIKALEQVEGILKKTDTRLKKLEKSSDVAESVGETDVEVQGDRATFEARGDTKGC